MTANHAAWLQTADRILAGDFDRASASVKESCQIGLRSFTEEKAQAAVARLLWDSPKTARKK